MAGQAHLFEVSPVPPPGGSTDFSLYGWESKRDEGIPPRFTSTPADDERGRIEFLVGARYYGLELGQPGRFGELQPQQLMIADVLNAQHDAYAVEIPRRASKTTSIFCLLLGRCATRPGYQVTFSAQSGIAGSRRLREWATRLDAVSPPDDQDLPPWLRGQQRTSARARRAVSLFGDELVPDAPADNRRGFRILRGEVGKGIYFDNGSTFLVLKPDADSYRGEAADVSWIDEAQEIDPDEGEDLLAAILPLQDTKPGSSIIVSGTAGEARVGPFWNYVNRLRGSDAEMGGIDYAAAEDTPWELIEDEKTAMQLLEATHPGVGTLTTLDKMQKNYRAMGKPQWAREYLSVWPETFGVAAIPADWWERAKLLKQKQTPARVAFGFDIKPGGSVGAIAAAWRDSRGVAYVSIVDHRQSTAWMPERVGELSQKYRGSTTAYDDIGEGKATATEMLRIKPRPRLRNQLYREHAAGCVQFLRDLEREKLRHFDHPGLNAAVLAAAKREVRGDERGIWMWTIAHEGADVTPLVAATRALRNWDQHFSKSGSGSTGIVVSS